MDIPYYFFNDEKASLASDNEAYIADEDLISLLVDLLGDDVSPEEINKILEASNDEGISEEEFDNLIDEFIKKAKK